jgi:Mg2+-importing ATPase
LKQKQQSRTLILLLNPFKSPIILILMAATILSSFLGVAIDTIILANCEYQSGTWCQADGEKAGDCKTIARH